MLVWIGTLGNLYQYVNVISLQNILTSDFIPRCDTPDRFLTVVTIMVVNDSSQMDNLVRFRLLPDVAKKQVINFNVHALSIETVKVHAVSELSMSLYSIHSGNFTICCRVLRYYKTCLRMFSSLNPTSTF